MNGKTVQILIFIAIIGILTVIIGASIWDASKNWETKDIPASQPEIDRCREQGGYAILRGYSRFTEFQECKFYPHEL